MTIKKILVLEDAVHDLESGKFFYDEREYGVGDYFWDFIISEIESLYLYAGIHKKEFNFHKMITRRFPYAIYYYLENNKAYIVAVLPMKRDPK